MQLNTHTRAHTHTMHRRNFYRNTCSTVILDMAMGRIPRFTERLDFYSESAKAPLKYNVSKRHSHIYGIGRSQDSCLAV